MVSKKARVRCAVLHAQVTEVMLLLQQLREREA